MTDRAFWEAGPLPVLELDEGTPTALERRGEPAVTVRGRSLTDVLEPAYEAFRQL